jgi:hypothetical protein
MRTPRFRPTVPRLAAPLLTAGLAFAWPSAALAYPIKFHIFFDASADVLTDAERTEIESHVRAAGLRWTNTIGFPVPRYIEVEIAIADIPTANGASIATAYLGTIDGRETYEQGVAHELRLNDDPNMEERDARITIGLDYLRNELWFDPDPTARSAPVPPDRTDAMSALMHEFGHIIAYNGWADLTTGEPNPDYWSIFDSWFAPGVSPTFHGPAATSAWGAPPELTVGNIFHWGNASQGAGAGCVAGPIEWRFGAPAPNTCSVPPSADRPRDADGSPGLVNQLMNGVVFYRGTRYDISSLDVGVLIDVGLMDDAIFGDGFELINSAP